MLLRSNLLLLPIPIPIPIPSSSSPSTTAKPSSSSSVLYTPIFVPLNCKPRMLLHGRKKPRASSYEVGGSYPDEELEPLDRVFGSRMGDDDQRLDKSKCDALLKGGEQVTSVLQEMITLLEGMKMNKESEKVAFELAAQGVIGKRVDEMESGFMMALDYMIQLAERGQDDEVLDNYPFYPY